MSTAITKKEESRLENVEQPPAVTPRVDVFENKDEVLLLADMPGVENKGLSIHLDDEKLTILGRVVDDREDNALQREFRRFDFRRSFLVPDGIDRGKISAELREGVLSLHLPKSEATKPRRIEVKAG